MDKAIHYKILQRKTKYRNPNNIIRVPPNFIYSKEEYLSAKEYILNLARHHISFSYPEHETYPAHFLKMKEPPLFFEYIGEPVWLTYDFISVVGSRDISMLTENWLKAHLGEFLKNTKVGVVSGGARGVDQLAHQISLKEGFPSIFVLPSGLLNLYPSTLADFKKQIPQGNICFISEFEIQQKLHKSHFYFRNRMIAALGKSTLVAQASLKSGSLLTVHHCLEIGKPVLTVPAHPEMFGFGGNIKLLQDGAVLVSNFQDLQDFWLAESWSN